MAESKDEIIFPADSVQVTCTAPVNIAVIKYWGKRDEKLILPINSSLSGTIDPGTMQSKTNIVASKSFAKDEMFLNGKEESIDANPRFKAVLQEMRARAADFKDANGKVLVKSQDWKDYKLRIVSHNNFPTAAGLASSASGYACLTKCLAELHGVQEKFPGELSAIARQGSGSACRSMYGGFVKWVMGEKADGSDSIAVQVTPETHWPEMRVLILVANSARKETSSTAGMQETVETSSLVKHRAEVVVPQRMAEIEQAIKNKDFATFGRITMQDSNQFHAVCLDTFPPIFYLNDTSKRIIALVNMINKAAGSIVAAYTFDAGPNAVIYLLEKDMNRTLNAFIQYFLPSDQTVDKFVYDPLNLSNGKSFVPVDPAAASGDAERELYLSAFGKRTPNEKVSQIIVSKVGEGAKLQSRQHSFKN